MVRVKNREIGFTLVELMLVFSIIMLLISIFAPNMYSIMNRARNADSMSNARRLQQCMEDYTAEAQEKGWLQAYPKDAAALMTSQAWTKYTLKNPYYTSANQFDRLVNLLTFTGEAYAGGGGYAQSSDLVDVISFQSNFTNLSPVGSCVLLIPKSRDLYNLYLAGGNVNTRPAFSGTTIYYPFKTGDQKPPAATDAIAGYEIRATDSIGKLIIGIKLSGGEPFQP